MNRKSLIYVCLITLFTLMFFIEPQMINAASGKIYSYCYYIGSGLAVELNPNDKTGKIYMAGTKYYVPAHELNIDNWDSFISASAPQEITGSLAENAAINKTTIKGYSGSECPEYVFNISIGQTRKDSGANYIYASKESTLQTTTPKYEDEKNYYNDTAGIHELRKLDDDYAKITEINDFNYIRTCQKDPMCSITSAKYDPNLTYEEFQNAIFGNPTNTIDLSGTSEESACSAFGELSDKDSLAYMIHQALSIARILAIVLVIVLGITDFAKSVIAGKEDEMRQNQKKFIKRIIACVVIFLVPIIMDIVMSFTDKLVEDKAIKNGYKCDKVEKALK